MIDACLRASKAASAGRTAAKKDGSTTFFSGPTIQNGGVPKLRALKLSQCTRSHMLTRSLPPILELQSLACIAPEGGRGEERWEESFCCYVLWESPVWRIYGQAGVLRADMAELYRF